MRIFCKDPLQGKMGHVIIIVASVLNLISHEEGSSIYLKKILFSEGGFHYITGISHVKLGHKWGVKKNQPSTWKKVSLMIFFIHFL